MLKAAIPNLEKLNRARWNEWRAVEADGNPGFFNSLVQAFLDTTPQTLDCLRKATEFAEATKARTYAHSLRSSCEVVGAEALGALLHSIELELMQKAQFPTARMLDTASEALDQIIDELQRELNPDMASNLI